MADYIVRATAAGAAIRAFAITSRDLVETARQDHNTSPIMTALRMPMDMSRDLSIIRLWNFHQTKTDI